MIIFSFERLWM